MKVRAPRLLKTKTMSTRCCNRGRHDASPAHSMILVRLPLAALKHLCFLIAFLAILVVAALLPRD